jgi:hypothetical protein
MRDAITCDEEIQELMKSMRGQLTLQSGEEIAAISKCKYGNANRDWDSLLTVTNMRILTRPRQDYDAKRLGKKFREVVVTEECFREIPLSEISCMRTKKFFDQEGPELMLGITNGKEIEIGETWFISVIDVIAELAGLERTKRSLGTAYWKVAKPPLHGLTLASVIGSVLVGIMGYLFLAGTVRALYLRIHSDLTGALGTDVAVSLLMAISGTVIFAGALGRGPFAYREMWKKRSLQSSPGSASGDCSRSIHKQAFSE